MAIISTLIGGVCGFVTFLTAMVFFKVGFLSALGLYALVGIGLTLVLITACLAWQSVMKLSTPRPQMLPYRVQVPAGNGLPKHRG